MESRWIYGEFQPLHMLPAENMLAHDLLHIRLACIAIPDCLGINDHDRSVLADIHASGMIDADAANAKCHAETAHVIAEAAAAFPGATAAAVCRGSLIRAAEDMDVIKGISNASRDITGHDWVNA